MNPICFETWVSLLSRCGEAAEQGTPAKGGHTPEQVWVGRERGQSPLWGFPGRRGQGSRLRAGRVNDVGARQRGCPGGQVPGPGAEGRCRVAPGRNPTEKGWGRLWTGQRVHSETHFLACNYE